MYSLYLPPAVVAMICNELMVGRWLLLWCVALTTYLAGVDLLTAEGVVVGTHDGCFSCGTGSGVGFLAVDCMDSMFEMTILARSGRVGHVIWRPF